MEYTAMLPAVKDMEKSKWHNVLVWRSLPISVQELPYKGAKEMLLVDDVDSKEFLTSLFKSMFDALPQLKKITQSDW